MLKLSIIVVAVLLLSGCASEVDKCVKSFMKVYELENPKATKYDKAHEEASAREHCLKISSGNT